MRAQSYTLNGIARTMGVTVEEVRYALQSQRFPPTDSHRGAAIKELRAEGFSDEQIAAAFGPLK